MGCEESDSDVVERVFDNFLKGPKIFINRDALRPDFIPDRFPHREEQLRRVAGVVAPVLAGERGSNLFVYGQTGTGKTAVVRFVLSRLEIRARSKIRNASTCYINCRVAGTEYRILASLGKELGVSVPFTGLATTEVLYRFRKSLEEQKCFLVVALDEVDTLVKAYGDVLLYHLTRINEGLRGGRLSLIGISNDLRFKEKLDPRVLSSLSEEELVFKPYTAPEIRDILLDRAKLAFAEDVLEESALNLCAAEAASEHGDARRALDLLRVAGEVAEREGSRKVCDVHVRAAEKKIEEDRVSTVLGSMPLHSKLVLWSSWLASRAGIEVAATGDLYEVYVELCKESGVEPLTQRRISSLINELDLLGLVNARIVSLGRYGRTKRIKLGVDKAQLLKVYSEDPWINPLLSYVPKCLSKS
ncbi:MAG: orc1/cdc6 family replication initiation protein [Candidatus Bathyarchaeia archaeon]